MIEKIEGIITGITPHNDRHNIVNLYSRQRGRLAFVVPVGKSRTGKMRNAALSLMAVIGAEFNFRQGKELYTLRNAEPIRLWHGIYSNPIKTSVLFFIGEFCNKLLRQYPADEKLWQFIVKSLETLDRLDSTATANFHIAFLAGMLPITGIEPAIAGWLEGERFDLLSGEMVPREPSTFLQRLQLITEEESRHIPLLLRINYRNMHLFRFSRSEREHLLNRILAYYSAHLPISTEYKSLDVLHELFR